ncbi:MAG: ATP-binding cassette domain-containing protein [Desulfobulbales bacterium]
MLEAAIVKQRPHCRVDITLACDRGSLLALTGPSGVGKTTIIRILAGLEKPDGGQILLDGSTWFDEQDGTWLPARQRRVGYVFQEHTLFPHLNVAQNVAFSCRDKLRVTALLELLGISHLARSFPHRISGGERQRAALAQALASRPGLLLLDEPFSALDAANRLRLRRELKRLKAKLNIPIILVTHDQEEARYLGDTHVPLASGLDMPRQKKTVDTVSGYADLLTRTEPCASHPL